MGPGHRQRVALRRRSDSPFARAGDQTRLIRDDHQLRTVTRLELPIVLLTWAPDARCTARCRDSGFAGVLEGSIAGIQGEGFARWEAAEPRHQLPAAVHAGFGRDRLDVIVHGV